MIALTTRSARGSFSPFDDAPIGLRIHEGGDSAHGFGDGGSFDVSTL
jgi:hypothetical protein